MKLNLGDGASGIVHGAKEVIGGTKDTVVNPVYTAGHAIVKAPINTVQDAGEAIFKEGLLGAFAQAVEGGKAVLMGPGELILGVREGIWRRVLRDGVWNNVLKWNTLNPLRWPEKLITLGVNTLKMPIELGLGGVRGLKRLLWDAPKHLVWGIPASLLRAISGPGEGVLGGAAYFLGGDTDKGIAGAMFEARDGIRRATRGLIPKTTIVPIGAYA